MSIGMYSAAGGMILEQRRQEVIARNLAASGIAGYKREYIVSHRFEESFNNSLGSGNKSDLLGSSKGEVKIDYSMGNLKHTDRPLDFVVQGDGYFEVKTPEGKTLYTKNGNFYLNKDRVLVTQEGYIVSGKNGGRIQFNADDSVNRLQCTTDGYIRIPDLKTGANSDVGQFKIVGVQNPEILEKLSAKYFTVNPQNKNSITDLDQMNNQENESPFNFQVSNRYLEMANNNPLLDMATMVQSNRDYEMNYKIVKMLSQRSDAEIRQLN